MRLLWEDRAWSDYLYWQTQDKKTLKRINGLIKDIQRNSFEGIGKPEPLKENLSGLWSRRIDDTNRIVYYEKDDIIYIVSCKGHYDDWTNQDSKHIKHLIKKNCSIFRIIKNPIREYPKVCVNLQTDVR